MSNFKGKKFLITGSAGFVGSHLARRLIAEGADLHLILREGSSLERIKDIEGQFTKHFCDLTDIEMVKNILSYVRPNGIFHLAAQSQHWGFTPKTNDLVRSNILATIELMEAASSLDLDFFVNTGSFAEVGASDLYSISRIPGTLFGQALGQKGKPFVTVRVFTPYGPYIQEGKIIYNMITKALRDEHLELSSPKVNRDFIYIDDLVEIYLRAGERAKDIKGEIIDAGTGVSTTLEELAQSVLKYSDSKSGVMWKGGEASYDSGLWQADVAKVKIKLQFEPKISLEEGIRKTVEWFRENRDYWNK